MSLHDLWIDRRDDIFGMGFQDHPRFPILIKVLDARDDLSIQVHPPLHLAASLGGEPKTEMWFIADCNPGAKLYVGLKKGASLSGSSNSPKADGTLQDIRGRLSWRWRGLRRWRMWRTTGTRV